MAKMREKKTGEAEKKTGETKKNANVIVHQPKKKWGKGRKAVKKPWKVFYELFNDKSMNMFKEI